MKSRDKNRISTIIDELFSCWTIAKPTYHIVDFLREFYNYDNTGKNISDFYKEDDFWLEKIKNVKNFQLGNPVIAVVSEDAFHHKTAILSLIKNLWDINYDLRFPQIVDLVCMYINRNMTDEEVIQKLQSEVDEYYGKH